VSGRYQAVRTTEGGRLPPIAALHATENDA